MATIFDSLPPELIHEISQYLDIVTLGTLRLVSKPMKSLFMPELHHCLHDQTVDLSRQGLGRLCALATRLELAPAVRRLNFTCLYYINDRESGQTTETTRRTWEAKHSIPKASSMARNVRTWMANALAEQRGFTGKTMCSMLDKALGGFGNLREITLEAAVVFGPDIRYNPEQIKLLPWRRLWARAIQAYHVIMFGIARSKPANLASLVIYQATKQCSVPTHEIAAGLTRLERHGFAAVAERLNNFSISMATTIEPIRPTDHETKQFLEPFDISNGRLLECRDLQVDLEARLDSLAHLLRLMRNLESLHLHLYTPASGIVGAPYQALLTILAKEDFPKLTDLTLRGMWTSMEAMQAVLNKHPLLRVLGLQGISLTSGWWIPIFATLSQMTDLKLVRLSGLQTLAKCLVNLEPRDRELNGSDENTHKDWFPISHELKLWHTRDIGEEELRKGLGFRPTPGGDFTAIGGSQYQRRFESHLIEYGPPTSLE
jgi:hypothetical protein